jgi:O-antigen ligase
MLKAPQSFSLPWDSTKQATPAQRTPVLGPQTLARICAAAALVTMGIPSPVAKMLTLGLLLSGFLIPIWIRPWLRETAARWLSSVALLAIVAGLLLALNVINEPGVQVDERWAIIQIVTPMLIVGEAATIFWAVTQLGAKWTLAFWSIGQLAAMPLTSDSFFENAWKYGWSLPLSVLLILALGRKWNAWAVVLAIVCISALFSTRSWVLITIVAFIAVILGRVSPVSQQSFNFSVLKRAAFLVVTALLISRMLVYLAVQGTLGTAIQSRTQKQLNLSSHLILAGRAEWQSAWALFREHPWGYGVGVKPGSRDLQIALSPVHVDPTVRNTTGIAQSFREGVMDFHSVFWSSWSHYGFMGMAFVLLIVILYGRTLAAISSWRADIRIKLSVAILLVSAMWDCFFSPLRISVQALSIALAIYGFRAAALDVQRLEEAPNSG